MKTYGIKIKKLYEDSVLPTRGSERSAGYDLYAHPDGGSVTIWPGETVKIGTGIAAATPPGWFGGVFARSGLASKQGLRPANCVGVVDEDYSGEIIVALHNDSHEARTVSFGDRIAQLVVIPYYIPGYTVVDELEETERGDGGFGSTGV